MLLEVTKNECTMNVQRMYICLFVDENMLNQIPGEESINSIAVIDLYNLKYGKLQMHFPITIVRRVPSWIKNEFLQSKIRERH
jgi:hypothetical protein